MTRDLGGLETWQEAYEAAASVYDAAETDRARGVMAEANHGRLLDTCKAAGIHLGAYDHRILRWLAGWEPETVQVVIGLIERARIEAEVDELRASGLSCEVFDRIRREHPEDALAVAYRLSAAGGAR